ncbi:MAG: hypothetical protein QOD42_1888 [Sphingomonadales bacterium]|jgi:superfamily II DNA or RNA helicase|nr:hypothetical protein [Sphingomonadales bacterium]
MLRGLDFKSVYKSDEDNILDEFYFPALSVANQYDRAVGFFSASTISYAAQALSAFVTNGGNIRLILGAFTDKSDIEAVQSGYDRRELSEKIGAELLEIVSSVSDELFQSRFEALAWLVAHGRLDVKIALRERGMFHDKVGIITDKDGESVVFAGSANESTHALLPTFNYESINVFPNWREELAGYYDPHKRSFERLWDDKSRNTVVLDLPTAIKERLIAVARDMNYTPAPEIEAAIAGRVREKVRSSARSVSSSPRLPKELGGRLFKMQDHQLAALDSWKSKGDFQGVFDLATGAGKTITAIFGTCRLADQITGLTCIIAVPYQNLADQWVDILSDFNIYPLRCYVSRNNWLEPLRVISHEMVMGSRSFAAIVVVNRTLKSPEFQEALKKFPGERLLWIGDECHHHSSEAFTGFLPEQADFRMGLSATPEHYLDEDRNVRLNEFYGKIVYSYTLRQAIEDKVLTPYLYHPHLVELTEQEAEDFVSLSEQIGRLLARQKGQKPGENKSLTALLMRRARLVGAAANKLPLLTEVLSGKAPSPHTLFYCGDGSVETDDEDDGDGMKTSLRQVEAVSQLLHKSRWDVSRFTSRESRQDRASILENFRLGLIDAMVAIRCLDEGIDVPACNTAYILASSRDPRQFIQRRGRILRRSPGKTSATIHDFIVVLPEGFEDESGYAKRLIKAELGRVAEFSSLSDNRSDAYAALAPYLRKYDLEHLI